MFQRKRNKIIIGKNKKLVNFPKADFFSDSLIKTISGKNLLSVMMQQQKKKKGLFFFLPSAKSQRGGSILL